MKLDEKIYLLGLMVLDELLLHRNSSKITEVTIEDAVILAEMIVHVNPHAIFTFSEFEIIEFYREMWIRKGGNR
jgi:hypothetical protein